MAKSQKIEEPKSKKVSKNKVDLNSEFDSLGNEELAGLSKKDIARFIKGGVKEKHLKAEIEAVQEYLEEQKKKKTKKSPKATKVKNGTKKPEKAKEIKKAPAKAEKKTASKKPKTMLEKAKDDIKKDAGKKPSKKDTKKTAVKKPEVIEEVPPKVETNKRGGPRTLDEKVSGTAPAKNKKKRREMNVKGGVKTFHPQFPVINISNDSEFQSRINPYDTLLKVHPKWNSMDKAKQTAYLDKHPGLKRAKKNWDARVKKLAEDIKLRGQLEPIILWETPENGRLLLSGFTRYEAVLSLKKPNIDAIIWKAIDYDTAKGISVGANENRTDLSVYEKAKDMMTYKERKEASNSLIAKIFGLTEGYVGKIIKSFEFVEKHKKAFPELLPALEFEDLSYNVINVLRLIEDKHGDILINEAIDNGWSQKTAEDHMASLTADKNVDLKNKNNKAMIKSAGEDAPVDQEEFSGLFDEGGKEQSFEDDLDTPDQSFPDDLDGPVEKDPFALIVKQMETLNVSISKVSLNKSQAEVIKKKLEEIITRV